MLQKTFGWRGLRIFPLTVSQIQNVRSYLQNKRQCTPTKTFYSQLRNAIFLNSWDLPITSIVNRHTALFPDASWAVHCTILHPMLNCDPTSWSQVTVGIPPELSVAVGLLHLAVTVDSLVLSESVWLAGQFDSTGTSASEKDNKLILTKQKQKHL